MISLKVAEFIEESIKRDLMGRGGAACAQVNAKSFLFGDLIP